ncbi:MAG: DinB family protein [Spirochaetota bacterium]|nr:DinB family protein [Spirochaetota bacterium]
MTQTEIQGLLQKLGMHLDELKGIFYHTSEDRLSHRVNENVWTAKDLLGHLLDTELVFSYRLKRIVAEDTPKLTAWNQNIWVDMQEYNQWDSQLLVDTLITLRRSQVFWLGRLGNDVWDKQGEHSERGLVTVQSVVELLYSHFLHHFGQIKERAGL